MRHIPAVLLLALSLVFPASLAAEPELVAGWEEFVRVYPGDVEVKAKIDTGADSSALHATNIRIIPRRPEWVVEFEIEDRDGAVHAMELPLVRIVRILRAGAPGDRRPVVRLGLCLGPIFEETEVNLADRSDVRHPLLIGRRFLASRMLVDPAQSHLLDPDCGEGR